MQTAGNSVLDLQGERWHAMQVHSCAPSSRLVIGRDRGSKLGRGLFLASPGAARGSLRHGHQLDDMAVVVLVIEAAAAIPVVELSVFKAPGPASEGEPSVLDAQQDRVEFGVAYVKRIMLACDSPLRISEVQRQCVVDAYRRKVTA